MTTPEYYPHSVNIELTLACNMRCRHCGSTAGRPRQDELSDAEWRDCFARLAALGCREICLLGGEPLVRRGWLELAGEVGRLGMDLVLISNGWRLDQATVARLAALPHLARIGISLDGAGPEVHDALRRRPGSFQRAWGAARALRDAGVEVGVITSLSRDNLDELPRLRDLLLDQDLSWQIQIVTPEGGRFEQSRMIDLAQFYSVGRFISDCRARLPLDRLPVAGSHDIGYFSAQLGHLGELEQWTGCAAGLYTLGITSDGGIKGCLSMHDDFLEGNLRRRPLEEIWRDPASFARNRRFSVEQLEGPCATCRHGEQCRAGCANMAYTATGSALANPYCFFHIEREHPQWTSDP